jgi:hypothetical protein
MLDAAHQVHRNGKGMNFSKVLRVVVALPCKKYTRVLTFFKNKIGLQGALAALKLGNNIMHGWAEVCQCQVGLFCSLVGLFLGLF